MGEIDRRLGRSVEEQVGELSPEELFAQLDRENRKLADLGVEISIAELAHGAARHGYLYEDRRDGDGGIRTSPMNFLMALVNSQPNLLALPKNRFLELGGVVSTIAMVTDVLVKKTGGIQWPKQLAQSPQIQLSSERP